MMNAGSMTMIKCTCNMYARTYVYMYVHMCGSGAAKCSSDYFN